MTSPTNRAIPRADLCAGGVGGLWVGALTRGRARALEGHGTSFLPLTTFNPPFPKEKHGESDGKKKTKRKTDKKHEAKRR